jgi:predicted transcriptional regulator
MAKYYPHDRLSRRERQALDIIIRLGSASARDLERELPDPPTYSAVRSILRVLTGKKLVTKKAGADRDLYTSAVPAGRAKVSALRLLVSRFFENSTGQAACALLSQREASLSSGEARELIALINQARQKGR